MSRPNKNKPTHTGDNGGAPSGTPQNQRPSSVAKGAFATTEHPHAPTNESPFAESKWSFADQLLNLRGGMVSSIGDIFKLNKFKKAATQRMKRHNDRIRRNEIDIELTDIEVDSLKRWRKRVDAELGKVVGSRPVALLSTKDLTELTGIVRELQEANTAMQDKLDWHDFYIWLAKVLVICFIVGITIAAVADSYGYNPF